jgi:hypothetical protein
MDTRLGAIPDDIAALKAALVAERDERIAEAARAVAAEAELAVARAKAADDQTLIAHQQLQINKLTRQLYRSAGRHVWIPARGHASDQRPAGRIEPRERMLDLMM